MVVDEHEVFRSELLQLRHLYPLPILLRREELSGRASVREVSWGYAGDGKYLDESVGMVAFSKWQGLT